MKPSLLKGHSIRVATATLGLLVAAPAFADGIVYTGTSVVFTASTTGSSGPLSTRATFTVDPGDSNVLRLLLENSSPGSSRAPQDLLTSFYFNVLSGTTTGASAPLTYQSALGQVYYTVGGLAPDFPVKYFPPPPPGGSLLDEPGPSNLQAFDTGDDTWQFRTGMSLGALQPPLAFGVGTVGNNGLSPNNFNGAIVGGFNFGIYVGEVTTQPLDDSLLVKDSIAFEFAGFSGFSLSQISPHGVFGFGTDPDQIVSVPEPSALLLAAVGSAGCLAGRLRRRSGRPPVIA